MDYPRQARLKILGRMREVDLAEAPALAEGLALPGYKAKVERAFVISVEAFDWNCPQHITQRYSLADAAKAQADLASRRTVGSTVILP